MRPIRFTPFAPNRGLAIGAGVAGGINQGVQNFNRVKMQRMQMEAMINQKNAMAAWRQSQIEKNAKPDWLKVGSAHRLDQYDRNGQVQYGVDSSGHRTAQFTSKALKDHPEWNNPKKLAELNADVEASSSLNYNEQQEVDKQRGQDIQVENKETWAKVFQNRTDATSARNDPETKVRLAYMRGLDNEILKQTELLKPTPGSLMPPDVKGIGSKLANLHYQKDQVYNQMLGLPPPDQSDSKYSGMAQTGSPAPTGVPVDRGAPNAPTPPPTDPNGVHPLPWESRRHGAIGAPVLDQSGKIQYIGAQDKSGTSFTANGKPPVIPSAAPSPQQTPSGVDQAPAPQNPPMGP